MRWIGLLSLLSLAGCSEVLGGETKVADPPAEVVPPEAGESVATVRLTPQAVQRLGIELAEIEVRSLRETRTYSGFATVPLGRSVSVAAPVRGRLMAVDGESPVVGARVVPDRAVFVIEPMLTPERDVLTPAERIQTARVRAEIDLERTRAEASLRSADARLDAAEVEVARAEQLLVGEAGTRSRLDAALAERALALAERDGARSMLDALATLDWDVETGAVGDISVFPPLDGRLVDVHVAVDQVIDVGTRLFDVARLGELWVRVPVYVGELPLVDTDRSARIGAFTTRTAEVGRLAPPAPAPPSADGSAGTVDLWYAIDNTDGELRPGQRVEVVLEMKEEGERRVIPSSAVVYDALGSGWVYEVVAEHTYRRRRVDVARVTGGLAVLDGGPDPPVRVVTAGVAELYGTEFGTGK